MWLVWGLVASFFAAALAESNRKFRLEPQLLNAWRATFATGMMAFSFPLMTWPNFSSGKNFYLVSMLDGVVTAIGMILFFMLSSKKTGRVTSMMLPVAAIGAYATWWLISPLERPELMEKPVQVMVAVFSLMIVIMSLQKIRANDNSWESFVIILPVGIALGVVDALTKWVLVESGGFYSLAVAYTFLSMVACSIAAWLAALRKPALGRKTKFLDRKLLWGSFWCGFWTAGMCLCLTFSLSLSPNPTYPGIIMAMTPIWLYFLNQMRRTQDDASPYACIAMIVGAVGLWLSTL